MFTVYMATNKVNGKRYIGVTKLGVSGRRAAHLYKASSGGSECPRFYDAIRKYGPDSFIWVVLCTRKGKADAYRREFAYVDALKPEYNVVAGGGMGCEKPSNMRPVLCLEDGIVHESATAAARHYNLDFSEVNKAARGDVRAAGGLHFIPVTVSLSESERMACIAKIDADFILARRRISNKRKAYRGVVEGRDSSGRRASGPEKLSRQVVCITDGRAFESASAAARYYDVDRSAIIELCNGKRYRKTVGGRKFEYVRGN